MIRFILIAVLLVILGVSGRALYDYALQRGIKATAGYYKHREDSLVARKDSLLLALGTNVAKQHCMGCHGFKFKTDNFLAGVVDLRGEPYLRIFLTRQDSLVQAKDSLTLAMKKNYGNFASVHNYRLNDQEIDALIYLMRQR